MAVVRCLCALFYPNPVEKVRGADLKTNNEVDWRAAGVRMFSTPKFLEELRLYDIAS
jgi:hypothetical protein